jgi:hypothetical protein
VLGVKDVEYDASPAADAGNAPIPSATVVAVPTVAAAATHLRFPSFIGPLPLVAVVAVFNN